MANKILKTLTLPNAQGESVTYELHPEWDNIENKPNFVGKTYEVEGVVKGDIFNDYENNIASGNYSHAEGYYVQAEGEASHAEGYNTNAQAYASHAEGFKTTASGQGTHAEGQETTASGLASHAEGLNTTASEQGAHTEGWLTTAAGQASHAEGYSTQANADSSHAEGLQTIASSRWQHVQGKYNVEDTSGTYSHIVGNGASNSARSNAHTLDWDGNAWYAGRITAEGSVLTQGSLVIGNTNKIVMLKNAAGTSDPTGYSIGSIQKGSTFVPYFKNNADNKLAPIQIGEPYSDECAATKGYVDSTTTSSPNLLDNWYFPNAVNQRGAKTYRSEGFTVDRWKLSLWQSSGAYAYPNKSDLTLHNETAQGTACSCYLEQTIDEPARLAGKTVTFSAKLRGVTVAGDPILRIYTDKGVYKSNYIRSTNANSIVTLTATLPTGITSLAVGIGCYSSYGGDGNFNIAIESMKLEVGSISTLANDAPPKYSEQLLECQRYYIRFASDGGQWLMGASNGTTLYAPLRLPVPMRVSPTFGYSNVNIYPYVSGGKVEITNLELRSASGTQDFMLYAHHASNALEAKQPGCIRFTSGGYIELSAEIAS